MNYIDLFCGAGGLSLGFKNAVDLLLPMNLKNMLVKHIEKILSSLVMSLIR